MLVWGLFYGTAYGIACTESPFEETEARAARALDAADQVWARLSDWTKRDDGELPQAARELVLAARRFYELGIRDGNRLEETLARVEALVGGRGPPPLALT